MRIPKYFGYNIILSIMFLLMIPTFLSSVKAATIKFTPDTATAGIDDTVEINVDVDPGSDTIKGAEAYVIYDDKILEYQDATDGGLFKLFHKDNQTGKIYVAGANQSETDVVSSPGTLGTLTFKALANGTATLQLFCEEGQQSSSVIKNDTSNTNIIECSNNGTSVITIGTGEDDTLTETPIPTADSLTPMPNTLPKSGIFDNVVKFAIPGTLLFVIGIAMRMIL